MSPEQRIKELTKELHQHNHLYYVENSPTISDYDFDVLLKELERLEEKHPEFASENSPTKRVGGDITKKFEVVQHDYPMLSLSNTYSREELSEFFDRCESGLGQSAKYICELKYDGIAISLRYKNGALEKAITRGDGTKGEDITANVRTVKSIPLQLIGSGYPEDFEVRGEIFMPLQEFEALNKKRIAAGEDTFANPRNTAAGTLKMQDSGVVAERNLDCYVYGFYAKEALVDRLSDAYTKLQSWGFKVPLKADKKIELASDAATVFSFIDHWESARENLSFEIDGIVIKVDAYSDQEELGYTSKTPKWAVAYKYKAVEVSTELLGVSYQVGRTGAVTPVAELKPVQLSGTTVKRASLHNADQIEKLDLHEGDFVFVEKGGEIIPKVTKVDLTKRSPNATPILFTDHCPDCNAPLIRVEGEAHHYCNNSLNCAPQVVGKLEHFISRKAMDIEGLGAESVRQFYEAGMVNKPSDLYSLRAEEILQLERWAEKSVEKFQEGLEQSKSVPFAKVLFALGIRFVGETVAKKLANYTGGLDALKNLTQEEIEAIPDIGPSIAKSVVQFFQQEANRIEIDRLRTAGLQLELKENEKKLENGVFTELNMVVSGTFNQVSREELKQLIEHHGGTLKSGVTSKVHVLVAGENMGPSKRKKAADLEVEIWSEKEFLEKIGRD